MRTKENIKKIPTLLENETRDFINQMRYIDSLIASIKSTFLLPNKGLKVNIKNYFKTHGLDEEMINFLLPNVDEEYIKERIDTLYDLQDDLVYYKRLVDTLEYIKTTLTPYAKENWLNLKYINQYINDINMQLHDSSLEKLLINLEYITNAHQNPLLQWLDRFLLNDPNQYNYGLLGMYWFASIVYFKDKSINEIKELLNLNQSNIIKSKFKELYHKDIKKFSDQDIESFKEMINEQYATINPDVIKTLKENVREKTDDLLEWVHLFYDVRESKFSYQNLFLLQSFIEYNKVKKTGFMLNDFLLNPFSEKFYQIKDKKRNLLQLDTKLEQWLEEFIKTIKSNRNKKTFELFNHYTIEELNTPFHYQFQSLISQDLSTYELLKQNTYEGIKEVLEEESNQKMFDYYLIKNNQTTENNLIKIFNKKRGS